MPEEPVDTKLGPMEAYLIEARSIGGLSGSPIFVRPHPQVKPNKLLIGVPNAPIYWLGLIHGHLDLRDAQSDMIVEDELNNERLNMGIAIAISVEKILSVIDLPLFAEFWLYHDRMVRASKFRTQDPPDEASRKTKIDWQR